MGKKQEAAPKTELPKIELPPMVKWEDSEEAKRLKEELEKIRNTDWTKPPHLR